MSLGNLLADAATPISELGLILRVGLSVGLGGIIGLERELRDKPAGFRTIILICLGACLFTVVSEVVGGPDDENTRIAAQIVSGIGFLGAGAILRDRQAVLGLTTAATIWSVAAVGMAVGFGHFALGCYGTAAIMITLFLFDVIEHGIGERRDIQDYEMVTANSTDALDRVKKRFADARLKIRKIRCHESDPSSVVIQVVAMGGKPEHQRLRFSLARSEEYTLRRS